MTGVCPRCPLCGTRHWSHQAHIFPRSPVASNGRVGAINTQQIIANDNRKTNGADPITPNRRKREVYNAYMRVYNQVMRAVKSGRACWWKPKETA